MLPDRVSNPGPLTYESGALPIALRGPALHIGIIHFTMDDLCCIGSHVSTSSMTLVFTAATSKNDGTLCKLDVKVKTERRLLGALTSLNLSRNSLKEKGLFYSKFYFENQMW